MREGGVRVGSPDLRAAASVPAPSRSAHVTESHVVAAAVAPPRAPAPPPPPPPLGACCAAPSEPDLVLVGFGGYHPEFDEEIIRRGLEVANIDTCHDPILGDWTSPAVQEYWLAEARADRILAARFDPPCKSFSCVSLNKDAPAGVLAIPQLRSRRALPGLPPTPPDYQEFIDVHERYINTVCDIAEALLAAGRRCIIEGPVDRGNAALGERIFRKKFTDHAPLEIHPRIVRLRTEFGAVVVRCFQCAAGGKFQKATSFICDPASAAALQPLARLPCVHALHDTVAHGLHPSTGQALSHESRIFPHGLAVVLAIVLGGGGALDVHFATARLFARVFRDAAAAKNLHQQMRSLTGASAAEIVALAAESPPVSESIDLGEESERQGCIRLGEASPCPEPPAVSPASPSGNPLAAVDALPLDWPERARAALSQVSGEADAALKFVSRRRAVPEDEHITFQRPFPEPTLPVQRDANPAAHLSDWPEGVPARPITVWMLWSLDGTGGLRTVSEMETWIDEASHACACHERGEPAPKIEGATWKQRLMPEWARPYRWDVRNKYDCVPIELTSGPQSLHALVRPDLNRTFFREWGKTLDSADFDMLRQVAHETDYGVLSRSQLSADTVFTFHHVGAQRNFAPAVAEVNKDTKKGWITTGWSFPPIMPARVVARNVATALKHKRDPSTGAMVEVVRHRLTTDDSFAPDDSDARNPEIDKVEWADVTLSSPKTLAEITAILKARVAALGVHIDRLALERIALWAIDLSDAYRRLVVHWSELWQQHFIWSDGVRLDTRCLFGTASMVGFFQRVSSLVLAVVTRRIDLYDAAFPLGEARLAWLRERERVLRCPQRAHAESIYLDDASGGVVLSHGERLHSWNRRSATCAGVESRPQAYVRLAKATFREAGWRVADAKTQLGFEIVNLGLGVTSEGEGAMFCHADKADGLLLDIDAQQSGDDGGSLPSSGEVTHASVEKLVGRLGYVAQVEPAAASHMAPMYAMKCATRKGKLRRDGSRGPPRAPPRLSVAGGGDTQQAYQQALAWWRCALLQGLRVPLLPKLAFPRLGEDGVLAVFSDAARERGTGLGAFAPLVLEAGGAPRFAFLQQRWSEPVQAAFDAGELSMPAGELYGAIVMAIALAARFPHLRALYLFTDCDAAKAALNAGASGSEQMNALLLWLHRERPKLQLLALHIPGKLNWAADGLSRDGTDGAAVAEVLAAATRGGLEPLELQLPPGAEAALLQAARQRQKSQKP